MKKHLFLTVTALVALLEPARAEVYPSRSITIVVSYPAGGPTDMVARVLAENMKETLGQPIIVENVGGGGGTIGTGRVARAEPDGYTMTLGHWGTHCLNGATYSLKYDVVSDFQPVALLSHTPQWLVARNSMPGNDLRQLVSWLKENPNKALAGTVGAVGGARVAGSYFQKQTGTSFRFIPYSGGPQLKQDLIAGRIDLVFDIAANTAGQVRSGELKVYGVLAKDRWFGAPAVPTLDEAGFPGIYSSYWHGLWLPKGASSTVVSKMQAAVQKALANPIVRKRFAEIGQEIYPADLQTPEALAAYQKAEIERWWPIIRAENLRAE